MRVKLTVRLDKADGSATEYVFFTQVKETIYSPQASELERKISALKDAGDQVENKLVRGYRLVSVEEAEEESTDA